MCWSREAGIRRLGEHIVDFFLLVLPESFGSFVSTYNTVCNMARWELTVIAPLE